MLIIIPCSINIFEHPVHEKPVCIRSSQRVEGETSPQTRWAKASGKLGADEATGTPFYIKWTAKAILMSQKWRLSRHLRRERLWSSEHLRGAETGRHTGDWRGAVLTRSKWGLTQHLRAWCCCRPTGRSACLSEGKPDDICQPKLPISFDSKIQTLWIYSEARMRGEHCWWLLQ